VGFGVGLASMIVPVYLSKFSRPYMYIVYIPRSHTLVFLQVKWLLVRFVVD
jgi:hypothetical protein